MTASSLRLVEPAFRSEPTSLGTFGPEVAAVARMAGFDPDPEQQLALDALFAFGPGGKAAAFEFAVICSRQNMKTGLFKMAALGWLFVTEQELIVWSAHEMKTTKEAFRDLENLITGCPALKSRLADGPSEGLFHGGGQEMIELAPTPATPNGQRIMFKARTNGGGRGLSGDKVILDEAFALQPSHMGSLLPTLSARPDPQVVYGSSAGLAESDVLRGVRDRGREGRGRLAYFEWGAPRGGCLEGCDHSVGAAGCALDDRKNWRRANPALGRRITEEYVAAERDALPPAEFARERLGWWDEPGGFSIIGADVWADGLDEASTIEGTPYLAVDVAPEREMSAVAVSGLNKALLHHIEVTENTAGVDHRAGVDWVLPRLVQLKERWGFRDVTIAAGSATESLVPSLEQAGFVVNRVPTGQLSAACGLFYDLANARKIKHPGQPDLTEALMAAQRRNIGDGAWAWGRRKSGDITPLYAATLALWASNEALNMSMHPINNVW